MREIVANLEYLNSDIAHDKQEIHFLIHDIDILPSQSMRS